MKGADLAGSVAAPPRAANGTHRAGRNGASKRANSKANGAPQPASEIFAAPFIPPDAVPVDAPMWPTNPAMWFQPELAPAAPGWTGLAIERRHRIPAPDFDYAEPRAVDLPAAAEPSRHVLVPESHVAVPQSDLAPLGWDPRALCRKEGSE